MHTYTHTHTHTHTRVKIIFHLQVAEIYLITCISVSLIVKEHNNIIMVATPVYYTI